MINERKLKVPSTATGTGRDLDTPSPGRVCEPGAVGHARTACSSPATSSPQHEGFRTVRRLAGTAVRADKPPKATWATGEASSLTKVESGPQPLLPVCESSLVVWVTLLRTYAHGGS